MKIRVEFLLTHKSDVYDASRVPCIGEDVAIGFDGDYHEVKSVIHVLDADPKTQVIAIVRVK
jgi:hypothetical protein